MKSALSTPSVTEKKSLRRSSIRSNHSSHSADYGQAATEPNNRHRRRVTHANPNIKMSDITDVTRDRSVHDKAKTPKSDAVYNFKCGGEITAGSQDISGMHVEWKATFDKPLEQLIYPSLQRFDFSNYDERRKIQQRLHGHYDSHFTSSSSANRSAIQSAVGSPTSSVHGSTHNFSVNSTKLRQINCELDVATSLENQKMFIHTPTWTVNITNPNANRPAYTRSRTTTEEYPLETSPEKVVYESTADEIEYEGEKYLRQRIKDKFYAKCQAERAEKEYLDLLQAQESLALSPTMRRHRKKGSALITMMPTEAESADMLYASIARNPFLEQSSHNSLDLNVDTDQPVTPARKGRVKLNQLSPEEIIYNNQKKYLKECIPKESDHLLDGFLYYRMHNDLNRAEQLERKALEQQKMNTFTQKATRRYSNNFTVRLSNRSKHDSKNNSAIGSANNSTNNTYVNVNEINAARKEDINLVSAEQLKALSEAEVTTELHLTRIRRVVGNQNAGVTADDIQTSTVGNKKATNNGDSSNSGKNNFARKVTDKIDKPVSQLVDYTFSESQLNPETRKRQAQDKLLLLQLDAGVLPETFIKPASDPNFLTVDLSNYGIGDTRGLCLGNCIGALNRLQSLGLSDNRLTAVSIPTIIRNLCNSSVMHIDLSFNDLHDQGAKALASYFRTKNSLRYLDLSNCGITCADIKIICNTLTNSPMTGDLEELYLSSNKIAVDGASGHVNSTFSIYPGTTLLTKEPFMNSVVDNSTVVEINLSQNGISNCTCFVVAKVLKGHPSMQKLDLNLNPLGEAGSRSIFRTILRGLRCFVTMRDCSYKEDNNIFNNTYPSLANPYVLDMSEPYKAAVLDELLIKVREDPTNCAFGGMTYREHLSKGPETPIHLISNSKQVLLKSTNEPWVPPTTGFVKFTFQQSVFVPTLANAINEKALNILQIIVENGRTDVDRKLWLQLLCQDIYFTTTQARKMIDRFRGNKTIGTGGLTVLDIIKSLWKFLLDTENMFDFLYEFADAEQRRDLLHTLTMKRYKFNWKNPTGHWRLNLEDKIQRSIMMQIIAINNSESDFSKNLSGRGDTSQMGNWFNFRNERYTCDRVTTERVIDKEFIKNVPNSGTIEFDYVSTTRPFIVNNNSSKRRERDTQRDGSSTPHHQHGSDNAEPGQSVPPSRGSDGSVPSTPTAATRAAHMMATAAATAANRSGNTRLLSQIEAQAAYYQSQTPVEVVNDDDFYHFTEKLGLSSRTKITTAAAMFILMDLQLASTKYYFSVQQVHVILDSFTDDSDIQSKVIICMFSRIKDLHNLDILIRYLNKKAQQDIIKRIGCLNLINPLKISFDYVFCLKYLDNRILLVALMELAAIESADSIIEDPTTELPIATMYGAYTRALNETRPETMKFTFTDFGVRTNNINWNSRRDLIKKFLVGTQPVDEGMYKIIVQYKELEAANALTTGPIDIQYASYLKSLKSTPARVTKTNKAVVNLMRNVAYMTKNKTSGGGSDAGFHT